MYLYYYILHTTYYILHTTYYILLLLLLLLLLVGNGRVCDGVIFSTLPY